MAELLLSCGEPAAPITLDAFAEVNADAIDATEVREITANIARQGYHSGGGGAAGEWIIGTESGLRVAMARTLIWQFEHELSPAVWAECRAGRGEPCAHQDANENTAEAYQEVFGEPMALGEDTPADKAAQDVCLARCNAAIRLACLLMVGEAVTDAEALTVVAFNDSHGLGQVVPGYTLASMMAALTEHGEA